MSLISHDAAPMSTQELPGLLKRWMTLQDEMTTLNAEVKQRKKTAGVLKDMIMKIMETNNLGQLNVSKGAVIRSTRESKEALSQDYMRKYCKEFFEGDATKADQLLQFLNENRGTKTVSTIRLVQTGDSGSQGSK
jgi:hypothetical protein